MKKQRHDNDAYYTHAGLVKALLDNVPISGDVCEPCAGEGHIANVLDDHGVDVWAFDICGSEGYPLPESDYPTHQGYNMADKDVWTYFVKSPSCLNGNLLDWTVTNPPYRQPDCQKIIENAWEFSRVGIAMLLRLSYLEPCNGRASFLQNTPLSHLLVFNPRPQFRSDTSGTDSCTVAWFVWQKDWQDATQVKFITDWKNNV